MNDGRALIGLLLLLLLAGCLFMDAQCPTAASQREQLQQCRHDFGTGCSERITIDARRSRSEACNRSVIGQSTCVHAAAVTARVRCCALLHAGCWRGGRSAAYWLLVVDVFRDGERRRQLPSPASARVALERSFGRYIRLSLGVLPRPRPCLATRDRPIFLRLSEGHRANAGGLRGSLLEATHARSRVELPLRHGCSLVPLSRSASASPTKPRICGACVAQGGADALRVRSPRPRLRSSDGG